MKYKLIRGSHGMTSNGVVRVYKAGVSGRDIMELDDAQAKKLGSRVIPYSGGGTVSSGSSGSSGDQSTPSDAWSFTSEKTVPEVVEIIQSLTDPSDVQGLIDAEKEGPNRVGVVKAGTARLAHLESTAEEGD